MQPAVLYSLIAYLLIALGVVGSVLPVLPGPALIWLGAALWAWADGWQRIGWPTLLALGLMALAAWVSDLALTMLFTRRAGASWRAVAGAIVGGLLGALVLAALTPIGSFFGALIGAALGVLLVVYLEKRAWGQALRLTAVYLAGWAVSNALKLALALAMAGIFVWQAFL